MVVKKSLLLIILCLTIVFSVNYVLAVDDCGQYSGWNGYTNDTACIANSCVWTTSATDPFCNNQYGCCLPRQCWQFDGTNESACTNSTLNGDLNCIWNPFPMTMWLPNGTQYLVNGSCFQDFSNDTSWGMNSGCWSNDGNKNQCTNQENSAKCQWKANDANQNPWCPIKSIFDAMFNNPIATITDVGCCEQKGCWSYDGNETQCLNNSQFSGLCTWMDKADDPWCPNDVGCCREKWCSEYGTNETLCNNAKTQLFMPCEFSGGQCQEQGGMGGFSFFNTTNTCMDQGGWWNPDGNNCTMPTGGFEGGGGGFMFGDGAHCWFADMKENVCKNITGCAYCEAGNGPNGITNLSLNNICANKLQGLCEGHDKFGYQGYDNANNTGNLNCVNIQIKSACDFGPLPNCIWQNSSAIVGSYCAVGTSSTKKAEPPVPFCEHPNAKNNLTLCNELADTYMMPCKWGNVSSNKTASDNCTFNSNAVFGSQPGGQKEYEVITSESSCVAAGGTWKSEYYLESGILKQDSWCEKGAMFDLSTGTASANKGNCDTDCWACEFNSTGGAWPTENAAWSSCNNSQLGYCVFTPDTYAPNQRGWCDYPKEMSYGAGDCQSSCKDCGLMQNPYQSCISSAKGCKWQNDTNSETGQKIATGVCVDEGKKTCDNDCFSCSDFNSCNTSSINCTWNSQQMLCKPMSFDGEICFDGDDNDNDFFVDCQDPDCSFDMSCGGNMFGDCGKYIDPSLCANAVAFGDQNCTWINFTWEPMGHCGMPGEDCWIYDGNMSECGLHAGCNNNTINMGGPQGFCDINKTKMDNAGCFLLDPGSCSSAPNCKLITPPFGGSGFCDYFVFSQCMDYNITDCSLDGNCTWNINMNGGMGACDVACFDYTLTNATCPAITGGICEWRDSSDMCTPLFFNMGGGTGAKTGCMQYDGNQTACLQNNYTCVYNIDSYANNNVSESEPSGWCNGKGDYGMTGEIKDIIILGDDGPDLDVEDHVDIEGFGMKVNDVSYSFGIKLYNVTDAAICNNYMLGGPGIPQGLTGSGNKTTISYWYLDTDNNNTNNCNAIDENSVSYPGYDFYLYHKVWNDTGSGQIRTTQQLFKCIQNSTGNVWVWVPTNVYVTDNKKFTCLESGGAIMVSIEKEAFENFDNFNITTPMRIFAKTANSSNTVDSVGPSYYTPGTVDFGFIDCSDPDVKDTKCKNFQKFGFQMFEDCKNGVDDDTDGSVDCDDLKCVFSPTCASGTAFDWTSIPNDYKAPVVMFSKVDKMADSAIVMFDTDEPANGTLNFYNTSSTCATNNLTVSLDDIGDAAFAFDDYKPFHRVILDSDTIGFPLTNSTSFYYKVIVCDPFGNCGTSSCLNFTTRKENKEFIFRMELPTGFAADIPALNLSNETFKYNMGGTNYNVGVKTNSSVTKNMSVTVTYEGQSLSFIGVDIYKPKTLNLEGAFIVDSVNNTMGMNSSSKSWNMLLSDLGLGGTGDAIEIKFDMAYNANNNLTWADDTGINKTDVNDYSTCTGNTSNTYCKVPTSLGFSVYKLTTPVTTPPGDTGGSSGGGSGGGGSSSAIYTIKDSELKEGYTKELLKNDKVKFTIASATYTTTIKSLSESAIEINISKVLQKSINLGETYNYDFDKDGTNDLSILYSSYNVTSKKGKVTFKSIVVEKTIETPTAETPSIKTPTETNIETTEKPAEQQLPSSPSITTTLIITIVGIIVIVLVIIIVYFIMNKSKRYKK